MEVNEYIKLILLSGSTEDKTFYPDKITFNQKIENLEAIKTPCRDLKIKLSDVQVKFPKKSSLHLDNKRGMALHFFANHELLAIEMMAASLLLFPHETSDQIRMKQGILGTIRDEQKHFKFYLKRMNELGVGFGDFPLNNFFWCQMGKVKSIESFFALMSLTFEAANLDFARYYQTIFEEVEDKKTADIMNIIYEDEIRHVELGYRYLLKKNDQKSMWKYYNSLLPEFITPARAKGISFDVDGRKRAGLDPFFIKKVQDYRDDFQITNRKK